MKVYKLTELQKNQIANQKFDLEQYFNPMLDTDGNWFISIEEIQQCTLLQATTLNINGWLLTLPQIDYNPVIVETP